MKLFFRYWLPALIFSSFIFYLSSIPQNELPQIDIEGLDKLIHLSLYTILGFILGRALTARFRSDVSWIAYRRWLLLAAILGTAFGITDEWHQHYVPGRAVEVGDLLMDALGSFLGAGLVLFYRAWVLDLEKRNDRLA